MCECHSGNRSLVLIVEQLERDYPELTTFAPGPDWERLPELDVIRVHIGPDSRWAGPPEVVHYLREVLDEDRLTRLRAAWVPPHTEPTQNLSALIHARPLLELVPCVAASPLLGILRERRLETWFQPIFHAKGLGLWGYECLMRARDEDGSLIGPGRLLEWARREQLTFMLDRVARETHLVNAGRAAIPSHAHILINFMPVAVYQPEYCLQSTLKTAQQHHIAPDRVIFEVVESEAVQDREHLATILGYYRQRGFGVALDDVGNGHAGLIMLADLDPDLIKIDRYLVQRAPHSRAHRSICASLVRLGQENNKLVLAEGVETAEEKAIMDRLGVNLYQGYYFAHPTTDPVTEVQHAQLSQTG